jgi:hypothetical protein
MKRQLIQTFIVGSFAAIAFNAGAQYTSPSGTAQNPPAGTMTSPSGTNAMTNTRTRMTDDQIREYMNARNACASQPAPQQESCNSDLNKRFSSVDSKCQKLTGPALADCLHGADHGG